jgi:hypothetical protein
MWLDAHDGQIAMSWEHTRKGESVQVESIATDQGSVPRSTVSSCASSLILLRRAATSQVFFLRSLANPKGTFFHVHQTIQGIQSRSDPYDSLLSDQQELIMPSEKSSSLHHQIGFASFVIPDAPTTISLLLVLHEDGQLTCRIFDEKTPEHGGSKDMDDKKDARPHSRGTTYIHPKDLLSRHAVFSTSDQGESPTDGESDDMDVDPDKEVVDVAQAEDDQVGSTYQRINTRDIWRSE